MVSGGRVGLGSERQVRLGRVRLGWPRKGTVWMAGWAGSALERKSSVCCVKPAAASFVAARLGEQWQVGGVAECHVPPPNGLARSGRRGLQFSVLDGRVPARNAMARRGWAGMDGLVQWVWSCSGGDRIGRLGPART